jgi:type IV pilus assembly protein PilY1
MNSLHSSIRLSRLVAACALALTTTANALALDLVQTPLFIPTPLNPNLVVTLDDSGSMAWAYVPDGISSLLNTRRFKSAAFNPIYFNPDTTYLPAVDASGSARASCSDATSAAACMKTTYINGFDSSKGTRNLATDYRPTSSYTPSSTSQSFGDNPTTDFPGNEKNGVAAYFYKYSGATCDLTRL